MLTLRTLAPSLSLRPSLAALLIAFAIVPASLNAHAQSAEDLDVLRVDLPLTKQSFHNGELEISRLIADNTYIDVDEFNLRAIELEAHTTRDGEVRLKVGRYVTPAVPLPSESESENGLLRIEAPHKTNQSWRLLIEDRVTISSLTAVLEPRHDNPTYYQSRYQQRGYTFSDDPYLRNDWRHQSRSDNWPYSWLRSDYDYSRRASHWLWLNDRRSRFQLNPSFGYNHRHNRDCYDRYGRHLAFGGQIRNPSISYRDRSPSTSRRSERRRNYLYERKHQARNRSERRRANSERVIDHRAPPHKPIQSQRGSQPRATIDRAARQQERRLTHQRAQEAQRAHQQRAQRQRAQAQRTQAERQRPVRGLDRLAKERSDRSSTRRGARQQGNRRGVD